MKNLSFKFKTVLAIAFVEAIALIILITSTASIMTDTNEEQIDRYVTTATRIFSATVKDALISYDLATLNAYAEELVASPDIVAAKIVSNTGQMMASAGDLKAFKSEKNYSQMAKSFSTKTHYRFSKMPISESGTEFGTAAVVLDVSQSIEGIQKAKSQAVLIATIEIIVAALVSLFLGFYLTRQLKSLELQTMRIQEGDLSSRIPVTSSDELGKVSESFNKMMDSLELQRRLRSEYERQLKELNAELEQRVEKRTQALKEANLQLTFSNKALENTRTELIQKEKLASLGRFAGGAAHEINNPLSIISGNLEILNEYIEVYNVLADHVESLLDHGELTTETFKQLKHLTRHEDLTFLKEDSPKLIQQMTNGSKRIGLIIDDLMQFKSRHNGSKTELEIGSTVIDIVSKFSNTRPGRIQFDDQTSDLAHCEINQSQLSSAINALLQNAIECSDEHSIVTVRLKSSDQEFQLKIIDNGQGIPAESIDKIKEPFFTTKPVGQGTGMGLTISESIIEGFGGNLSIDSTVNQGTTVTVRLPSTKGEKIHTRNDPNTLSN